ncbi:hypothetical protein Syun_012695 [Stephania yunnanensis]|uniref:Uncharacterized protein n=1 Tax=Stephania yunnanensis TaxID=152371 RepID=A0AAP0K244_9MAGN
MHPQLIGYLFLFDDVGMRVYDPEGVENIALSYFGNLFNSSYVDSEAVIGAVQPKVTLDMNEFLTRQFTLEEFKKAIFDMHLYKSSGPDGFNLTFFLKNVGILWVVTSLTNVANGLLICKFHKE